MYCYLLSYCWFFFFKQKTAYEMRISDWSSDVCSSDLRDVLAGAAEAAANADAGSAVAPVSFAVDYVEGSDVGYRWYEKTKRTPAFPFGYGLSYTDFAYRNLKVTGGATLTVSVDVTNRSEEHTSELQPLMRI